METEAGKRVFGWLMDTSYRDRSSLVVGSFETTAYNEGMRAVANRLANTIRDIDPRLLAECEIAVREFDKVYAREAEQNDDDI
jgi:hypothetical protein